MIYIIALLILTLCPSMYAMEGKHIYFCPIRKAFIACHMSGNDKYVRTTTVQQNIGRKEFSFWATEQPVYSGSDSLSSPEWVTQKEYIKADPEIVEQLKITINDHIKTIEISQPKL